MGRGKCIKWTKEMDKKLISEMATGKSMVSLEISMRISAPSIKKRLREMGFDNFIDAKKKLFGL